MTPTAIAELEEMIRSAFESRNIPLISLDTRHYPDETVFIAMVPPDYLGVAAPLGNDLDKEVLDRGVRGFVTVRTSEAAESPFQGPPKDGVRDPRAAQLINLLTARSRTSEVQPSLAYVPDAANNIALALAQRHHLVFGRRGAGKTALLVEAKRLAEANGHATVWINVQTYRRETVPRAFFWVARAICDRIQIAFRDRPVPSQALAASIELRERMDLLLAEAEADPGELQRVLPQLQNTVRRFLDSTGSRLYMFLDDFHYFNRENQPDLLDALHASIRDCDAWLKIATIQHLTQWFRPSPPTGLQMGHDADVIDLDLTLQDPSRAKGFLEKVLGGYARYASITTPLHLFAPESLDRLVLASGAVPRDYLVLCAGAMREAQKRENARLVGVQDVNKAAGQAASNKLRELEDDAASAAGRSGEITQAISTVRRFCLDEKKYTYFRVDFEDREAGPEEYALLQEVLDLRLLHLISPSLSDERQAGRRSEVLMLDLSQFSGERLKKNLRVLDFVGGHLVVKQTGTTHPTRVGNTPKKLMGLLRRGPLFQLTLLRLQPVALVDHA